MSQHRLKPYSVAQFFTDVEREFKFLVDEYGFVESSSQWTSHRQDFGFAEHVTTATPRIAYQASMRHVSIDHDRRGAVEVRVTRMFPASRSVTVEEIAREAGVSRPEQYGETYDMTQMTAADRVEKLAAGLRAHGAGWLEEPEAP